MDTSTAPLPADQAAQQAAGPACAKCDGTLPTEQTTVCPHCGWYAALGIHVEVSQEWEEAAQGVTTGEPAKSHLEVWATLVPFWAWLLVATAVVIAAASVAVRVLNPEVGGLRTTWAVSQLIAGLAIALACHITAFVMVATGDPDMGFADILVSPFKAWRKLLGQLPKRLAIVNTANASVVSAVCAAGIIGGIPYENLLDWGFDAPVKKSLLGAVMENVQPAGGSSMSMEEAMSNFAGDARTPGDPNANASPKPTKPATQVARRTMDALIVGYEQGGNGTIGKLLIATERKGKLVYSGRVTATLEAKELADFTAKLRAARAPRPIVRVPTTEAVWVRPQFTCRVSYERRSETGVLTSLLWEKLLGEMKLPW